MDANYLALAAKYVRRQAKQLGEQLGGVCTAEDIEFVHRARVASRRLRAALRMFRDCFGSKRVNRWREEIRQAATELGDARDKDVQIEYLCDALQKFAGRDGYLGMARTLVHAEREREALQARVVKAVKRLRKSRIIGEMQAAAKRILAKLPASAAASPEGAPSGTADGTASGEAVAHKGSTATAAPSQASPFARGQTELHIRRRQEELLSYQESLTHPDQVTQHHAMRIAAKRLRYTLEIARPVYPGQLEPIIEAAKQLQTLLGDIHDCDVWVDQFEAFAEKERKNAIACFGGEGRFARLKVGLDYLCQDRRQHRVEVLQELVVYWQALERRQTWENLVAVLEGREDKQQGATASDEAAAHSVVEASVARRQKGYDRAADEPSRLPPPPPHADEFMPPARPTKAMPPPAREALRR
jgi:CHAD domain-containing protein